MEILLKYYSLELCTNDVVLNIYANDWWPVIGGHFQTGNSYMWHNNVPITVYKFKSNYFVVIGYMHLACWPVDLPAWLGEVIITYATTHPIPIKWRKNVNHIPLFYRLTTILFRVILWLHYGDIVRKQKKNMAMINIRTQLAWSSSTAIWLY